MRIKDKAKPKVPAIEPGVYMAVCIGVIDLGEQYSEMFKNYRNEVQIVWEIPSETVEIDGETKPRQLSRTMNSASWISSRRLGSPACSMWCSMIPANIPMWTALSPCQRVSRPL